MLNVILSEESDVHFSKYKQIETRYTSVLNI